MLDNSAIEKDRWISSHCRGDPWGNQEDL